MAIFTSFDISASGMTAQRLRSDIISQMLIQQVRKMVVHIEEKQLYLQKRMRLHLVMFYYRQLEQLVQVLRLQRL